ncbi:MAG: hypothetical protein L0Y71_06155 [Gemmataceae bacterium]|nr:hypothetical protein [Gemmataceae bacterium]
MLSIPGLLSEIRRRPGMFLGEPSLVRLAPFVDGYGLALDRMNVDARYSLMAEFRDWIQARYHSTKASWDTLILQDSKDDADAFDRFWRLMDEFLTQHPEHAATTAPVARLEPATASVAPSLESAKRG